MILICLMGSGEKSSKLRDVDCCPKMEGFERYHDGKHIDFEKGVNSPPTALYISESVECTLTDL